MEWIAGILVVAFVWIVVTGASMARAIRENRKLLEQISTQMLELKHGLAPLIKREHDSFFANIDLGPPEESERAIQVVRQALEAKGAPPQQGDENRMAQGS